MKHSATEVRATGSVITPAREEERLEFVNVENKFENSEADDDGDTWQMVIHL